MGVEQQHVPLTYRLQVMGCLAAMSRENLGGNAANILLCESMADDRGRPGVAERDWSLPKPWCLVNLPRW